MRVVPGCVAFLFACGLSAQTFVVDAANGPGTNFTSLAVATATVPDGAVLEVRPGTYAPFAILGKSLTVRGAAGVNVASPANVAITVIGVAAHQTVELTLLNLQTGLLMSNCDGFVLVDRCTTVYGFAATTHALDCTNLQFIHCHLETSLRTVWLERCSAVFRSCTMRSDTSSPVFVADQSRVQLVDTAVRFGAYVPGIAIGMGNSDLRCLRSGAHAPFGSWIVGSGDVRFESAPVGTFPWPIFTGVTVTYGEMPVVKTTGGALGTNLTVEMTGPNGAAGALFVALPVAGVTRLNGVLDPLWLRPGTVTMCFLTTFASGVPQQSVHAIPDVAAFRGVRLPCRATTPTPGSARPIRYGCRPAPRRCAS